MKSKVVILVMMLFSMSGFAQNEELSMKDEDLKKRLTPMQYHVTQEKGTERAFTGEYYDNHEVGKYFCVVCDAALFTSNEKYDSGCGWPSFYEPVSEKSIIETPDYSHGMVRTEITCGNCGAHLGHVFNDGPRPTGLRYCVNSASLNFEKREE